MRNVSRLLLAASRDGCRAQLLAPLPEQEGVEAEPEEGVEAQQRLRGE